MEYECRIDSRDPDMWMECFNPAVYGNLTSGQHTFEVRALDVAEMMDPTPARYTWTVGSPANSDAANVSLTAVADAMVDQVNPADNFLFEQELEVKSDATGDALAVPPEPVVGQNGRMLVRFTLPTDASQFPLESATLKLYTTSGEIGRTLEAIPLAGPFKESTVTWGNQPGVVGAASRAFSKELGYVSWDVTDQIEQMLPPLGGGQPGLPNHGFQIRDAHESDTEFPGSQEFASRELPQDPPEQTLPILELIYEKDPAPAPPPPAMPTVETEVVCGQTLLVSTKLANDLSNCLGEGLVAGADNIVIDLNGHTVDGPDYLVENVVGGQEEGFPGGIRISGKKNVLVTSSKPGGTVQQFGYGVLMTSGTIHSTVENITVARNAMSGVELFDADDGRNGNTVRNNTIHSNELGVSLLAGTSAARIIGNDIFGSLGEAVLIEFSDNNWFENNRMVGVPLDPNLDSDGGVLIRGSSRNTIKGGEIRDTGDAGVGIDMGANDNTVQDVVMYRNGDAGVIVHDSDGTKIINIVAHQESDGGVVLNNANNTLVKDSDLRFNPSGVEHNNSNDVTIEGNNGSDSLQTGFEIGNGLNIKVLNNVANRTGGAGIGVEGGAFDPLTLGPIGGALIQGNTTNENGESGISVADGGHTIRANKAYHNSGHGIVAGEAPEAPGEPASGTNIDGGGNQAAGNGAPDADPGNPQQPPPPDFEQCLGVVCTTGDVPERVGHTDTEPPNTIITKAPDNPTGKLSATFEFTATDNRTPITAMTFECRLDPLPDPPEEPEDPGDLEPPHPNEPPDTIEPFEGFGWTECISPHTYHGIEPGSHHFEVRATDAATPDPLMDLTPAVHDWSIDLSVSDEGTGADSSPPDTFLAQAPGAVTTSDLATFRFTGSDNLTPGSRLKFECRLYDGPQNASDPTPWQNCTNANPQVIEADPPFPLIRTFEARAIDLAETPNTDPTPASHTWKVIQPPIDMEPPATTIVSGPDPTTVSTSATFTFASDEPNVRYECQLLPADAYEVCDATKVYSGLPRGPQELRVRAIDIASNAHPLHDTDPTPEVYTWIVGDAPELKFVFCGQVVTKSIIVNNDLADCLWDGIVVGAPGITIDLNGHVFDGKGVGAGIRNDGYDSVTIRNGLVQDFDYGVMLNQGTTRNIVEEMRVQQNQEAGIALGRPYPVDPALPQPPEPPASYDSNVDNNTIRNNMIVVNDQGLWITNKAQFNVIEHNNISVNGNEGVWVDRSDKNTIEGNEIFGTSGEGILLAGSNENTIKGNALEENGGGGIKAGLTTSGIAVGIPSNDNVIEGNTMFENGGNAIEVEGNSSSYITGNEILDNYARNSNGDGISLDYARDSIIRGNDVRQNKAGISLKAASGNLIEQNDASESEGDGIGLQALSLSNTVRENISNLNDGDGIYVGDETSGGSGMLIESNQAHDNKGYGIFVPKVSHILKNNHTNDNDSWGIWVSEGSNGRVNIDGGGNRAQGNIGATDPITLRPLQCFAIQCVGGTPFNSDQIPPITLLIETPSETTIDTSATFRFSGSDNASTVSYECRMNEGEPGALVTSRPFTACDSPKTYADLAPDTYTFEVRAVDVVGNIDATPAVYTWFVEPPEDGRAPITKIDSGPMPTTVDRSARFELSADLPGATYECALDNGAWLACESAFTLSGLPVGPHTLDVRATANGNRDATPARWAWRITAAPIPHELTCGEILTRSVIATNDLIDCPGNGVIIGANGVTLDLDGHTIDGIGIDGGIVNMGFDSVTIRNGFVTEFDYGVLLNPGSAKGLVTGIRAEFNQEAGIALADADEGGFGNTVRDNTVVQNKLGIALYSNTRKTLVHDNHLGGNLDDGIRLEMAHENQIYENEIATSSGFGVYVFGGHDNVVRDNALDANLGGVAVGEELIPSNRTIVERNEIVDSLADGIVVMDSADVKIRFNVVRDGGSGVIMELARNALVKGNDLSGNVTGVVVEESTDVMIDSNNASGGLGSGIEAGALSANITILNNAASGNGGEGIEISDSAPAGQGTSLMGNTADANGGDGISVEGVGHLIGGAEPEQGNTVQLNGGWGIYAVGAIDRGNNFAAGNMEPGQCFGVICRIGAPPGAPDTWIVDHPPALTSSRNASFTYNGHDEVTPLIDLVFECRLDTDDDLAWEDCEYPMQYSNLAPGHHKFEVRAIDMRGSGLADHSPASWAWTYQPGAPGDPPDTFIDLGPPAETWLPETIFTYHADEPDVTFECKVDDFPYEVCSFDELVNGPSAGWEVALEEEQFGLHTFYVRAIDFEGNFDPTPAEHTWRLLGIMTSFTGGPGFTPGETPFEPATGGPTLSNDATITFEANVADADFECSLDLEPFEPCESPVEYENLMMGEHLLRVLATSSESCTRKSMPTSAMSAPVRPVTYPKSLVRSGDRALNETSRPVSVNPMTLRLLRELSSSLRSACATCHAPAAIRTARHMLTTVCFFVWVIVRI